MECRTPTQNVELLHGMPNFYAECRTSARNAELQQQPTELKVVALKAESGCAQGEEATKLMNKEPES
jgi:hypothetical protein